jgi:hypothetical protein
MIFETGDIDLFPELKIPRSTIRDWFHRGIPDVVTCNLLSASTLGGSRAVAKKGIRVHQLRRAR